MTVCCLNVSSSRFLIQHCDRKIFSSLQEPEMNEYQKKTGLTIEEVRCRM